MSGKQVPERCPFGLCLHPTRDPPGFEEGLGEKSGLCGEMVKHIVHQDLRLKSSEEPEGGEMRCPS